MESDPRPLNLENTEIAFAHKSDKQLKESYRLFKLINNSALTKIGIALTQLSVKLHLPVKPIIKATIYKQFCGGETVDECKPLIEKIFSKGVSTMLDYGIEAKSNEKEFDEALSHKLRTIEQVKHLKSVPITTMKFTSFCPVDLLYKIQYKQPLSDHEKKVFENSRKRLDALCDASAQAGLGLFIDGEESWIQNPIDELVDEVMEKYNRGRVVVYNTYQLYRTDRLEFLKRSFEKSKQQGFMLGAKLVRGAYVEQENERAGRLHYVSPIHRSKELTDRDYNSAIDFCLDHIEEIKICAGTHNAQSLQHIAGEMERRKLPPTHPHIFHGQLFGMSDNLTFNMAAAGFNSYKLIPYGRVRDVVPYLMRRAMENTSISGQMSRELLLLKKELLRRALK